MKPTIDQLRQLLDFLQSHYNIDVTEAFEIVKFADNMMFGNEGFPVTHCGAGITSLSIHPDGNVYPCVKRYGETDLITNIFNTEAVYDILIHRKFSYRYSFGKSVERSGWFCRLMGLDEFNNYYL